MAAKALESSGKTVAPTAYRTKPNVLHIPTGEEPVEVYAEALHLALTKFLILIFADSTIELDEARSTALNCLTEFMVRLREVAANDSDDAVVPKNSLSLEIGSELPHSYAKDMHRALLDFMSVIFSTTQIDLDNSDVRVLGTILQLMKALVKMEGQAA